MTLDSRIPAEDCSKKIKSPKTVSFWHFLARKTHFSLEGLHRARFSWLLGCVKIEKKRKAREREAKDDDDDDDDDEMMMLMMMMMMMMMMRWDDDDDEMMIWWWADDDEQTNTTGDF